MHIAKASDPRALVQYVRSHMRELPYLVMWADLPAPAEGRTIHLYGAATSETDALKEAIADHPFGELVQRIEYLDPARIAELRAAHKQDPVAAALKDLGVITK